MDNPLVAWCASMVNPSVIGIKVATCLNGMIAACFPSGINPAVMQCVIATSIDCGVQSASPGDTSSAFRHTRSYCSTVYPMRSNSAPDIATRFSTRLLTASAVSCFVVICYSFSM